LVLLAVKVTERLPLVATTVFVPSAEPTVQLPEVATPEAFVTTVPPVTVPPPAVTANVTEAPASGAPFWSRTITDGGSGTSVPGDAV
jgi:hypothetical protein